MRFTIRDLLWLTVVGSLAVLWCGEYRQRMSDSAELRANYLKLQQDRDELVSRLLNRELWQSVPPGQSGE